MPRDIFVNTVRFRLAQAHSKPRQKYWRDIIELDFDSVVERRFVPTHQNRHGRRRVAGGCISGQGVARRDGCIFASGYTAFGWLWSRSRDQ